jgi:hypothetical protein
MESIPMLPLVVRWLHIFCACLAVGGPFFVRYVLIPAAEATLDVESHAKLREAVNRFWRVVVYIVITLFILSGLYTFVFVVMPLNLGRWRAPYHALFGLKMVLALGIFFLASVLPGRMPGFEFIRARSKFYLSVLLVMLFVVLMLASGLRMIRDRVLMERPALPPTPAVPAQTV